MEYTEIMVRYGELSTKGKNIKDFINRLGSNTMRALHDFPEVHVYPKRDRMHVVLNGTDPKPVMDRLKLIFGIQTFSPVVQVEKNIEVVYATTIEMMQEQAKAGMTFKVQTKRSDKEFPMDTNAINREVGGKILEAVPDIDVDVKKPDIQILVDVRQNGIFISSETIKGAGGFPVGTAGKGMMMLSGGIDSPVAAYLGMKRGVDMEMVHFFSPPYTTEQALAKSKQLTEVLSHSVGAIKFIQIPFTEIQETIKEKVPEGYLMTIQRRLMLRLSVAMAEKRGGMAIFNGEALGQVASQTMESMMAINDVTVMPVIRPVVSMDKTEIIKVAEEIGTFDLSIMPFEDCCTIFAPPSPKTRPNLEKARAFEALIDVEGLMERALAGTKIVTIKPGKNYLNPDEDIFAELL